MQVACPSCTSEYAVDERRLPASGLKMRCPKCGARFHVSPSGEVNATAAKPAASVPKPAVPRPGGVPKPPGFGRPQGGADLPAPKGKIAPPMPGADLPAPKGKLPPRKPLGDEADLPAPRGAFGSVPRRPKPEADLPAPRGAKPPPKPGGLDLDLPAPRAKKPIAPPIPGAKKPREELDLDLPAPRAKKPIAPPIPGAKKPREELDLDLPAPRAKKPIAPPVPGASPPGGDLDLDLPAPFGQAPAKPAAGGFDDLDLDLPAPRIGAATASDDAFGDLDLPAPRTAGPNDDLDLPAPRGQAAPAAGGVGDSLDLPRPFGKPGGTPAPTAADSLDLPRPFGQSDGGADLPAPAGGGANLPAPAERKSALADGGNPFDDLDLPTPRDGSADLPAVHGGNADLPAPAQTADLPGLPNQFAGADLPVAKSKSVLDEADEAFGDLDLPVPKSDAASGFGDLDLPVPKAQSDLPVPKDNAFGDLELPTPRSDPAGAFDDLDLPTPREVADLPQVSDGTDLPQVAGFSDLPVAAEAADLPVARPDDDFDDLALPDPRQDLGFDPGDPDPGPEPMRDASGRTGVGGVAFGELDLGEGSEADDMEFADIPSEPDAGAAVSRDSLPPPRVVAQKEKQAKGDKPKKKTRPIVVVAVMLGLLLAAGGALGFTPYGFFGINLIDQFLPGAGDPAQVRAAITSAEETAMSDRWLDVRESLQILGRARAQAGLNAEMLSHSLAHEALYQVRFGDSSGSTERAARIAQRIQERSMEGPEIALGLAANALRLEQYGQARTFLAQARQTPSSAPYADLILGEAQLAEGSYDEAITAFEAAAEGGGGARALWGVARARLTAPLPEEEEAATAARAAQRAAIEAVLEASPQHGAALAARADIHLAAGEVDEAYAMAQLVAGLAPMGEQTLRTEPAARASAFTVVGQVEEQRGRASAALAAYDAALSARDTHVPAFLGAGRVLLADRPRDALVRFESVLQAEGSDQVMLRNDRNAQQEARLGIGRAQLALDRVQDANATLEALLAELPEDSAVLLWLGKANQASDPPAYATAEGHFREAIRLSPQLFEAYLALAELFLATDRGQDAGVFIERAEAEVPESAEMRYQLGAFELRRNNTAEAIEELDRALELEPDLPPALFSLAVARRRSGRLDAAAATFDRLAGIDGSYPGLSLERGLLYEAQGESERAVSSYEAALEADPEDLDLLLRLGAAQVSAGRIDDAEETLDRVRAERPNSAEANHFVGRVAFARGNFAESLNYFRQAVQLDPSRGEFHLYVGWAALENGQLGESLHSVDTAIARDPSLGDAYWIRGVVKLRSGRPRDALEDLLRALELKPSRHEAHASIGDAYDQLSELDQAISSYEAAVERVDDNGRWWYRLGRLRMDRGDRTNASEALQRATLLGDAMSPLPGWLAEAHRLRGECLRLGNSGRESVRHYRRYLELAPASAIDRRQVREILMDMGEVP